jgi:hypothetical protein
MKQITLHAARPLSRVSAVAFAAATLLAAGTSPSLAAGIDVGNPDISLRFDNQVRYNLGFRAEGRDSRIANNPNFDEGDYKFNRGDVITNRLDLLSELELDYKKRFGARVSATAWYDNAYRDTNAVQNPALAGLQSSYINNQYSSLTKRYYRGLSGEILDAFVYANFDVGSMPASVKIGSHSVYWGNAVFSGSGISYSQQHTDARKALANPGVETRETFMPLPQISGAIQVTDAVQVAGQYYLDWDHLRSPEGGTYLGGSDFSLEGPDRAGGGLPFVRGATYGPAKKRGNWGLSTKIAPYSWNGTTLGLYYREFDEKNGLWLFRDPSNSGMYRAVFPRDTKIIGASIDATVGPFALGGEVAIRKNAGLNSSGFSTADEGARGDVAHFSVNTVYGLSRNAIWDSGTITGEITFDHLMDVTKNKALFNGVNSVNATTGAATCPLGVAAGCATRNAVGIGVRMAPSWSQIFPSVDLTVPIAVIAGIKGNTADFGGTSEGQVSWSIGAEFDIRKQWLVTLSYADVRAKIVPTGASNSLGPTYAGNGAWQISDRGRFTLTVKSSF